MIYVVGGGRAGDACVMQQQLDAAYLGTIPTNVSNTLLLL